MATTIAARKTSSFRNGLQAGVSIAIGYIPIAITFGLLAKSAGLTVTETVLMSLLVFAGAAQYMSLNMIVLGSGVFEIVMTTFILNIRHFLMSASLNEKVEEKSLWKKSLFSFGITDETFSVTATKEGTIKTGYMFGVILIAYSSWVVSSGIGHVIGSSLPSSLQESMAVALYAMFVGLLMPSLKKHRKVVMLAGAAAILNSVFSLVIGIAAGWSIVLATITSAVGIEILYAKWSKEENADE
ncbi:AzlC family ABC transporter permease [Sutcliffiella horikoshii]|uniref:AzlC family ABC transporter permease n=1 Tax=Sutcliffiella horikoshii TaxID=79883 RepID=UPI001CBE2E62|nr:AzlC family ABC transporter permease [Sutcliffiella horikoshii]UAL48553.1 AzlC family ABC transporter permease [Sutcliffiella horikoshii]